MDVWNVKEFSLAFMAFFAISNPISNLPVFLSLLDGQSDLLLRQVARRALLLAFVIVALFAMAGQMIFHLFGISLEALRIAGGVLVFMIGFHMLQGERSAISHPPKGMPVSEDILAVAVSPLATPLIAGPGTIATAMNFSAQHTLSAVVMTVMAFFVLCLLSYFVFAYGAFLLRFLGHAFLNVLSKMMGLILAVIGAQMLIDGIKGAFFAV